jgi:23S rRNA (cytosine1962-C5)-methyltransferase
VSSTDRFANLLGHAIERRESLLRGSETDACRVFSGLADGCDGVFVDRYAAGAVLIDYEGRTPVDFDPARASQIILDQLAPFGVRAAYYKPFARDRSKLGGQLPPVVSDPTPLVGEPLPESILIREHAWQLEVRLYDGLSTGLFLDQRDNRRWVHDGCLKRKSPQVLNTFAYTCAFSVAAARAGAVTTSVDVSPRYLDWGKRNFAHNGLDPEAHRFARMDTFEFFAYARRKGLKYDLIVLDPPSFASGNKKKGIKPWSSVSDYPQLLREAIDLLNRNGTIFASTNTQELCRPGRLEQIVIKAAGRSPRWIGLPDMPLDFARDQDRFSAVAFGM